MPRQIIDIESSRPAYQRRLAIRWIVAIVLVLILAFVAFELWKGSHHGATVGWAAPGNVARLSNLGLLSSRPAWGS